MKPARARTLFSRPLFKVAMAALCVLCAAPSNCGFGGGGPGSDYTVPDQTTQFLCNAVGGTCTENEVQTIVNQAANEAVARGAPATIAVVDRVGNVLAVAQMGAAPAMATIQSPDAASGGLEGIAVPSTLAAISKAITAAYLSSGGNAFTTRTANQIIQQNFPLQDNDQPGGPLFGVQLSQLACSDLLVPSLGKTNGPHPAPLGLAADAGGLPLYKSGVLVGGIGVMSTAQYSINVNRVLGDSNDEGIALAGQSGFAPPVQIEASQIAVNGVTLDYVGPTVIHSVSPVAPGGANFPALVAVPPFYPVAAYQPGQTYGQMGSGVVPDTAAGTFYPAGSGIYVLASAANVALYPPTVNGAALPSGDGMQLTAAEAEALVYNAVAVADDTRAGIRIPINSHAEVTISVIDLDGNVLAIGRTPDAPMFGTDVSLQKARSAVFFSRNDAVRNPVTAINALPAADASTPDDGFSYYGNAESVADPALFNQGTAFSELAIGALARPFLPDGEEGEGNGPLSLPIGLWSPFSTGLQADLVVPDLKHILGGGLPPTAGCGSTVGLTPNAAPSTDRTNGGQTTQLANGLQIFSGGLPIYRSNGELVGGIGISGDGIMQDALIGYIGIQGDGNINVAGVSTVENAPAGIRADQPSRVALTPVTHTAGYTPFTPNYIGCPPAPFLTTREQTPCGTP